MILNDLADINRMDFPEFVSDLISLNEETLIIVGVSTFWTCRSLPDGRVEISPSFGEYGNGRNAT